MEDSNFHVDLLFVLIAIATAVAMSVKWVKLPYSIALVIVGLFIGIFHLLPPLVITPELILLVFLPALLFEASWNLDLNLLKQNAVPIGVLATVGVVISAAIIASFLHFVAGLDLVSAILFGAMVSATDPVSVIALFKQLGTDKRLVVLMEGESLFNDGTAVVLFRLILSIAVSGAAINIPETVGNFCLVVIGGIVIGGLAGFGASKLTQYFEDHLLEVTLTTVVAYGSFLLAERFQVSPVLAVVTAGIVLGNYGSRTAMSPTTRLAVDSVWEYAAFVVNSLIFLLIGLQIKVPLLIKYLPMIGIAIIGLLVSRAVVIYTHVPICSRKRPIPLAWQHLLFWGGLRGALSMALALSIPLSFQSREALIIITFGVVLFTLLVQGLTLSPLVKLLKIIPKRNSLAEYRILRAKLLVQRQVEKKIENMLSAGEISPQTASRLSSVFHNVSNDIENRIDELHVEDSSIHELEFLQVRMALTQERNEGLIRIAKEMGVQEDDFHALKSDGDTDIECIREELQKYGEVKTQSN